MPGNLKKLIAARRRLTGESYQAALLALRDAEKLRGGPSRRAMDSDAAAWLSVELVPPKGAR